MMEIDGSEHITIGRPLGNVSCYIVDEANEEIKQGEIGELLICGEGVGLGYKNLPETDRKDGGRRRPHAFNYCRRQGGSHYNW